MKKIMSLVVISLMLMAIFLVGCAIEEGDDLEMEDTVEVVDEDGALVGEAIRVGDRYKIKPMETLTIKNPFACLPEEMKNTETPCLPGYHRGYLADIDDTSASLSLKPLQECIDQGYEYYCNQNDSPISVSAAEKLNIPLCGAYKNSKYVGSGKYCCK